MNNEIKDENVIKESPNLEEHKKEKVLTPLNIFLIMLLIFQIGGCTIMIAQNGSHTRPNYCPNAWDCNCDGKKCECSACENGGVPPCEKIIKIKCPDHTTN